MTDYDKLNEAMSLRQRALTKVAWWSKKVEEAELEIKAQIEATYSNTAADSAVSEPGTE